MTHFRGLHRVKTVQVYTEFNLKKNRLFETLTTNTII